MGPAQMCCTFPMHWRLISHSQSAIFKKRPKWRGGKKVIILWLRHSRVCSYTCGVRLSSADRGWLQRCFPLNAESLCLTLITGVGLLAHLADPLPQLRPQRQSDKMRCGSSDRPGQLIALHIKSSMGTEERRVMKPLGGRQLSCLLGNILTHTFIR